MATPSLIEAKSPWLEMGAYEALWSKAGASFKTLAETFKSHPDSLPSDFVHSAVASKAAEQVMSILSSGHVHRFGVRVYGLPEYPERLRKAEHPVQLLYYQGWWDLVNTRCVSVVGTRKPTPEGVARAAKLVRFLVEDRFTIVSGLALGIDTIAHQTAIQNSGRTIGVLGTPLSEAYPKSNAELQREIAKNFLLLSQVPVLRHRHQSIRHNRLFFPARNVTMAALSEATVIIEAGETSGTLTQARAALNQGKLLFILDSCFTNPELSWPQRFLERGAIRVKTYDDIRSHLAAKAHAS